MFGKHNILLVQTQFGKVTEIMFSIFLYNYIWYLMNAFVSAAQMLHKNEAEMFDYCLLLNSFFFLIGNVFRCFDMLSVSAYICTWLDLCQQLCLFKC